MTDPTLIIGALGQDGRLLADRLMAEALPVIGVVRPGSASKAHPHHTMIGIDLDDTDAVNATVVQYRPSRIFYIAAVHHSTEAAPANRSALWPAMLRTNCLGLINTLHAVCRHAPACRLIFAASSQMYTASNGDLAVDETTPRHPRTFYGETKAWSLDAIAFARANEGLRGGTAILFNHESALRSPSFITRKVTRAAAAIRLGQQTRLAVANLHGRADWSSAEDVVDGMLLMSRMDVPKDYVIGSGSVHSVEQLLDCAFGHIGLAWRDHVDVERQVDEPVVYANPRLIETELGWRRCHNFETLIRGMVDADLAALGGASA